MADAAGLGPVVRKDVGVQIPPPAPKISGRVLESLELGHALLDLDG